HAPEGSHSDRYFAHLFPLQAKDLHRIFEMDVAVAPARTRGALQDAADEKRLPVNRSVLVGRDHHHGVADFGLKPPGQQLGHQDLTSLQSADAFFSLNNARSHAGTRSEFLLRVNSVD